MKTLLVAFGMLVVLGRPAVAQPLMSFGLPTYSGRPYAVAASPYLPYGYPAYPYYPYPLPPAPSLGFGRGGIYGHAFVGRDESITSYTFPGRDSWSR
jgi:hypothetical protein